MHSIFGRAAGGAETPLDAEAIGISKDLSMNKTVNVKSIIRAELLDV
jgi:hypothetical protein